MHDKNNNKDGWVWGRALVAAILSSVLAVALVLIVKWVGSNNTAISLTLLGLAGIVGLMAAISLISVALNTFGLNDKEEALGLPTGSVRAIIALSLIVFFIIASIYYFTNISTYTTSTLQNITPQQFSNIPVNNLVSSTLLSTGNYDVIVQVTQPSASVDFAKQVLTTLSTLVVAISAFYFGTKAGTTKTTTTLTSIAVTPNPPDELKLGLTQQFTATGAYSDGSTADISSQVTWISSDATKAKINSRGLATGVGAGSTSITANLSGTTSPAVNLTVIPSTS